MVSVARLICYVLSYGFGHILASTLFLCRLAIVERHFELSLVMEKQHHQHPINRNRVLSQAPLQILPGLPAVMQFPPPKKKTTTTQQRVCLALLRSCVDLRA